MLSIIGLGLGDATDITLRGLELARRADVLLLESYTALLCDPSKLEETIGRRITVAHREDVENGSILHQATGKRKQHVALLVVGDPLSATTHMDLCGRAREHGLKLELIHNASIMTAVAQCGLQLYRFGQTVSLCFWTKTWQPTSWFERLCENHQLGLHTLLLLDIKTREVSNENLARGRTDRFEPPRFMTVNEGIQQVLDVASSKQSTSSIKPETLACGLARVGGSDALIRAGPLSALLHEDFGPPLHSLVIAGRIDSCEAEYFDQFLLV